MAKCHLDKLMRVMVEKRMDAGNKPKAQVALAECKNISVDENI